MRNSKEKNKELYTNLNRLGISIYVWYNWCKMRTTIPSYIIENEKDFLTKFLPKETLKYYNL